MSDEFERLVVDIGHRSPDRRLDLVTAVMTTLGRQDVVDCTDTFQVAELRRWAADSRLHVPPTAEQRRLHEALRHGSIPQAVNLAHHSASVLQQEREVFLRREALLQSERIPTDLRSDLDQARLRLAQAHDQIARLGAAHSSEFRAMRAALGSGSAGRVDSPDALS